jgi:hypothetical protein
MPSHRHESSDETTRRLAPELPKPGRYRLKHDTAALLIVFASGEAIVVPQKQTQETPPRYYAKGEPVDPSVLAASRELVEGVQELKPGEVLQIASASKIAYAPKP